MKTSESRDEKTSPHLIIIGFSNLVFKKYMECIEDAIHKNFISSYSIVDLVSKEDDIRNKVKLLKTQPDNLFFLQDKNSHSTIYVNQFLSRIKSGHKFLKFYIATELRSHEMYLEYCILNNIDSLVEKPIIAPFKDGVFCPNLIDIKMKRLIKIARKRKTKHSVMTLSRYHEVYNNKILNDLNKKIKNLKTPITSIHLNYSGGVCNTINEYKTRNDHPYKYGYGMIMHGAYHYVDIFSQLIKLNSIVFPNEFFEFSLSSFKASPLDQKDRISLEFRKKINDDYDVKDYFLKKCGETDLVASFCITRKKTKKIITVGTISFEQSTTSLRTWAELPQDIYNKNGRVSSLNLSVGLSSLFSINCHSSDKPSRYNNDIDRIDAIHDITEISNPMTCNNSTDYFNKYSYDNISNSFSNKKLLMSWLVNDEKISRIDDHLLTMRLIKYLLLSARKPGKMFKFDF